MSKHTTHDIPYGYCHCGCGQKTNISPRTDRRAGLVKGEPRRYIVGHHTKKKGVFDAPPPNPSGLCQCGCGEPAPIATVSSRKTGWVKGQPLRYIAGHHARNQSKPLDEPGPNPGGKCLCGCGQPAPIAKMTSRRYGWVRGKPKKYIHGHTLKDRDKRTLEERFWDRVEKRGPDDCWLYLTEKGTSLNRYGTVIFGGKSYSAHRVSWEIHFGKIPDDVFICHHCDVKNCCNPAHLFLGSPLDNMRDKVAKGRMVGNFTGGYDPRRGRGETHPKSKLTEDQVRQIRQRRANGEQGVALAKEYGVLPTTIASVYLRKSWRHVE